MSNMVLDKLIDDLFVAPNNNSATKTQVPAVAATNAVDGIVMVQIGPDVWPALDLYSKPASAGDTLTVEDAGNSLTVVRNITREKNPPVAPGTNTPDTTVSSGCYDWTDDTQLGAYAQDIAETTRALAADINRLRTSYQDLSAKYNALLAAVKAAGIVV